MRSILKAPPQRINTLPGRALYYHRSLTISQVLMKVIIAGSRTIEDYDRVAEAMAASGYDPTEVVSGGARGVDELGEKWARRHDLPVTQMPADWEEHGKAAGPKRNARMADYADALVAVWDGRSPGTRDMLRKAHARDLPIYLARTDDAPDWTTDGAA